MNELIPFFLLLLLNTHIFLPFCFIWNLSKVFIRILAVVVTATVAVVMAFQSSLLFQFKKKTRIKDIFYISSKNSNIQINGILYSISVAYTYNSFVSFFCCCYFWLQYFWFWLLFIVGRYTQLSIDIDEKYIYHRSWVRT